MKFSELEDQAIRKIAQIEDRVEKNNFPIFQDKNGNVLPRPRDRNNHLIDSVFYGLGDGISRVGKVEYAKLKDPYL